MGVLYLRPSDIRYSQDSVNNFFDSKCQHSDTHLGETLDDLCEGRCQINDIRTISVMLRDGKWFTADNRRLWVFKHLERLGKCSQIPVNQSGYIPDHKFTTVNDGDSVRVRGEPGGKWYRKDPPKFSGTAAAKTLKPTIPSNSIHNLLKTQTDAVKIPHSKPPTTGEINFPANRGVHTTTDGRSFQVQKPFGYSEHTNITRERSGNRESPAANRQYGSIPKSSDNFSKVPYSAKVSTRAYDDVHIPIKEQEVQKPWHEAYTSSYYSDHKNSTQNTLGVRGHSGVKGHVQPVPKIERIPTTQNSVKIQIQANDDKDATLENVVVQVHDESKFTPKLAQSKREENKSRNLECCPCPIL